MSTERSGRAAKAIALALGLGLFAFIGVRVKETLADRKAMEASLAASPKGGPKREAPAVVRPKPIAWRASIPVTGTLAPIQEADVGFKAGGRLAKVAVKVGDAIAAGQLLAALDGSEASAQAATAGAAVHAAEVSLEMAKDAERRVTALFDGGAVSEAERTAAKNRTALAAAQLEQARAQARLASVGVGNGSLAAPFPGLVTRAPNGIGKIVAPGEPLFRLEDTRVLKLNATVSEGDARLVEIGAAVAIEGAAAPGKVTAVLGSLDAQTRRVPIVAEIPNPGGRASAPSTDGAARLLAGSFVRATITSGREVSAFSLPASAIRPGSQDEIVIVAAGKAHLARVVATPAADGSLVVRSGVAEGDDVALHPSSEVHEGDDLGAPAAH